MPDEETRAIVYETDGIFMGLCPDYPGITGSGSTKEECVSDLTEKIRAHLEKTENRRVSPSSET